MSSRYEDLPDFNEWLDERHEEAHGTVIISGQSFRPSEILYNLAPIAYEIAYDDFLSDKVNQIKESVFSEYPAPIAYHFYRFEYGYEDELQRLHFLRSTWEAIINLIHAITVCEARYKGLPLKSSQVKMQDILADSLAQRLQNVQHILSFANENNLDLNIKNIIPEQAIKIMATLNKTRNAFSHSDAISTEQAGEYISDCIDDVIKVLEMLSDLKSIYLIRYLDQSGLTIRFEAFDGHAMTKTIKKKDISQAQLSKSINYFDRSQILVLQEDDIFSLKPFIHFRSGAGGHETRLCYFKKCHSSDQDRKLRFEILGEAQESDHDRNEFQAEIDELRSLFDLGPEVTT